MSHLPCRAVGLHRGSNHEQHNHKRDGIGRFGGSRRMHRRRRNWLRRRPARGQSGRWRCDDIRRRVGVERRFVRRCLGRIGLDGSGWRRRDIGRVLLRGGNVWTGDAVLSSNGPMLSARGERMRGHRLRNSLRSSSRFGELLRRSGPRALSAHGRLPSPRLRRVLSAAGRVQRPPRLSDRHELLLQHRAVLSTGTRRVQRRTTDLHERCRMSWELGVL